MTERELRFARMMSDAEAVMWTVEKDPRLSSNIATVTILDRPCDTDLLRRRIAKAVADIPRMRERVAPVFGRLAPPEWEPDPDFDLDHHLRRLALPPPGSDRQLFDLATTLLAEPFDRTRPLWTFVVVEGLSEGRGALITKLHHTVTDGEGGVRLAERYMELERDAEPPPDVDLAAIVDEAAGDAGHDGDGGLVSSVTRAAGHTWRRGLGMARRTLGEATQTLTDPPRLVEGAHNVRTALASAFDQLAPDRAGSPVWARRSRHRRFDVLDVPFGPSKAAAKALGGTLNDLFVTGAVGAGVAYHRALGVDAPYFNVSFILSTRTDRSAGGNAFTPSKVRLPAADMDVAERFAMVRDAISTRRGRSAGVDTMGAVAGIANLLPTSVVTRVARDQAAAIDFATSNVRAAPFDLYMSGAKVLAPYPMGPVAGTAWNITMLSYAGTLFMGVHMDPVAVTEPDVLMRCLREAFTDVVAAGGNPSA